MKLNKRNTIIFFEILLFFIAGGIFFAYQNNQEPIELATFESDYKKVYGLISHYKLDKRSLRFENDDSDKMSFEYSKDENLQIDRGQFVFIRMNYGKRNHSISTITSPYNKYADTYYMSENLNELKIAYVREFLSKANEHIDRFDYKLLSKHAFIGPMECQKRHRDMHCLLKLYLPRHFRGPATF